MTFDKAEILKSFGNYVPKSELITGVAANCLSDAIGEFINPRFKGLCQVEIGNVGSEYLKVSVENLAYFLRLMMEFADSRSYLDIKVYSYEERFVISIFSSPKFSPTLPQRAKLISAAKAAGFTLNIDEESLCISAEKIRDKQDVFAIYARSFSELQSDFIRVFFE